MLKLKKASGKLSLYGPSILLNGADGNLVLRRQQKVLPATGTAAADAGGAYQDRKLQ